MRLQRISYGKIVQKRRRAAQEDIILDARRAAAEPSAVLPVRHLNPSVATDRRLPAW